MGFENKVVLITGASSGIGAATAIAFAKESANVVIVGRNETKLKLVEEKCAEFTKPLVIKADISDDEEAKRTVKETIDKFGRLDVLVNNAGLLKSGSITDGNIVEAYDETMKVNVRALLQMTVLATPYLKETKGNIVNVSSNASNFLPVGFPTSLPYYISKTAVDRITKGTALELSQFKIRVNSVNPGYVRTDFLANAGRTDLSWDQFVNVTALKAVLEPEEVADLILYLAGDKAKGITGSNYVIDNGKF